MFCLHTPCHAIPNDDPSAPTLFIVTSRSARILQRALTCQSKTAGLTSDLLTLDEIWMGGGLAHTPPTWHPPTLVWFCDRSLEDSLDFCFQLLSFHCYVFFSAFLFCFICFSFAHILHAALCRNPSLTGSCHSLSSGDWKIKKEKLYIRTASDKCSSKIFLTMSVLVSTIYFCLLGLPTYD